MAKLKYIKDKLEHVSSSCDPDQVWKEGAIGFFLQTWSIYFGFAVDIFGTFSLAKFVTLEAGVVFFTCITSLMIMILIIRHYRIVTCKTDGMRHLFAHVAREYIDKLCNTRTDLTKKKHEFQGFNREITQSIADIFSEKVFYLWYPDNTIGCIIKLYYKDKGGGVGYYRTVGRSSKLHKIRKENPTIFPADIGLGAVIRKYDGKGVYIIRDLKKAIEDKAWSPSDHDDISDINTRMIAPINGYKNGKRNAIGMIFVTSAKKNQFCSRDALVLMGVADLLGTLYSAIFESLSD